MQQTFWAPLGVHELLQQSVFWPHGEPAGRQHRPASLQLMTQQSVPALHPASSAPQHVPSGPQLPSQQSSFDAQGKVAGLQHRLVVDEQFWEQQSAPVLHATCVALQHVLFWQLPLQQSVPALQFVRRLLQH
jgi:hypothetical protein